MGIPEDKNQAGQLFINVAVPILLFGMSLLTAWMTRLDDRQYEISQQYVSKKELKESVDQLSTLIEQRREQQAQANDQILDEVRKTNKSVQDLAIKIERISKSEEREHK